MSRKAIREYFKAIYARYRKASKEIKQIILNEFCSNTGYNRKYAIRKLNGPTPGKTNTIHRRRRKHTYGLEVLSILAAVWEAAGYPCSARLKALIKLWLPWIRKQFRLKQQVEKQLISISARQMDRRLKDKKAQVGRRMYGRTKPGTLLKHDIPIRTNNWDVKTPGWTEVDTVSHSGNCADGKFAYTINQTTWVESRAVLIVVFLLIKVATKFIGIWPRPTMEIFRFTKKENMYTTLLMSTGLTFGTISALFGYTNKIINQEQYTILVTAVILSAVVPTIIAQKWFQPDMKKEGENV